MKHTSISYSDIVTPELSNGAIINNEYHGFREDYLVLHCLLKKYLPSLPGQPNPCGVVLEIGTNMGTGTNIICNALPDALVLSLDLPNELAHTTLQHPISEGKGDSVGHRCKFPYTQLRGDSMTIDYSAVPANAYFIDGEHDQLHVEHETREVLKCKPTVIIYHDADIPAVWDGIIAGIGKTKGYELFRVEGTRIAYLFKK